MPVVAHSVELTCRRRLFLCPGWAPAFAVWIVWVLMVFAALYLVTEYGAMVPFWDDWNMVPVLTGNRPLTASWLWEQMNEHRIPLPRLVLLAAYKMTGNDFRAGAFLNVLCLAGVSCVLILVARKLRGLTSYTDCFFPIALLHWGQYEVYFIGTAVNLVLPATLTGVLLALILQGSHELRKRVALLFGICLLLLPLCGASGLALVPALAVWLGYVGIQYWRSPQPEGRLSGLLVIGLACASLLLVFVYFVGYRKPYYSYDPSLASMRDYLRTSVQFLSVSLGPAVSAFWPHSGLTVLCLLFLSLSLVARAWWIQPQERFRALGLLLFLGAMLSLALGLGWGRSTGGHFVGFQSRYTTCAVPLLCCLYFIWDLYSTPIFGTIAKSGLCLLVGLLLMPNSLEGIKFARGYQRQMDGFNRDLRGGDPPYLLLRRYSPFLFFSLNERLGEGMRMLHDANIGVFRFLQPDPVFREELLSVVPAALGHMTWGEDTARGHGKDPRMVIALPRPRFVAGIRITYSYPSTKGNPLYFQVFWRRSDQSDFHAEQSYVNAFLERSAEERTVTVWIGDKIDQLRLHLDNESCACKIWQIVLVVPADDG